MQGWSRQRADHMADRAPVARSRTTGTTRAERTRRPVVLEGAALIGEALTTVFVTSPRGFFVAIAMRIVTALVTHTRRPTLEAHGCQQSRGVGKEYRDRGHTGNQTQAGSSHACSGQSGRDQRSSSSAYRSRCRQKESNGFSFWQPKFGLLPESMIRLSRGLLLFLLVEKITTSRVIIITYIM